MDGDSGDGGGNEEREMDPGDHAPFHLLNHWFCTCTLQGWVCLVLPCWQDPQREFVKLQSPIPSSRLTVSCVLLDFGGFTTLKCSKIGET